MTVHRFDAIVVGAGQAGPPLAARLTAAGMTVAVAERGLFGGTCVNTGCTPTKTLVASAYAAQLARRGAEYGVSLPGGFAVDMRKVKARKDEVAGNSRRGVEAWLDGMERCTVFRGHARFESPASMNVNGETIAADRIFLDVGGRAAVPDLPGLAGIDYLTNVSILELDALPRHLVILGGSYIGLEFAQMYRRFGAEVTVIERGPRLIQREDEDVSAAIREILEGEGVVFHLGAQDIRFAKHGGDIAVSLGGGETVVGSHLLVAVGRRPNTDDLGLDKAGVAVDGHGYVTVDDQLRTSVPGIWALGDCNGRGAFTHTAYNDFEIVAANLLDDDPRRVGDRIQTYALYVDPPLGRAGLTEAQVRQSGRKALVGTRPMTRVARAVEKGDTRGFMKVVVDAETRHILGAAILGVGGDEVVHSILDVMAAKAPYTAISRTMHIHPTVSELVPTMLQDMKPLS